MHPMHLVGEDEETLIMIWRYAQGGFGAGHLPAAGGVMDQPSCVMRSLDILQWARDTLRPPKRGNV